MDYSSKMSVKNDSSQQGLHIIVTIYPDTLRAFSFRTSHHGCRNISTLDGMHIA